MIDLLDICFAGVDGLVEFSFGGLTAQHRQWLPADSIFALQNHAMPQQFFGPAVRKESDKKGKDNCLGSRVCWMDYDRAQEPKVLFPPTVTVWSGHGWHLYWRLEEFCTDRVAIETANKVLARSCGGDSAHNIDRLLRLPGSINAKEDPPVLCKIWAAHPRRSYRIQALVALTLLDQKMVRKILTGDRRGYPSRSERDMAIVRGLVAIDLTDGEIELIFQHCACGDKYRDPRARGPDYLARTIAQIRATMGAVRGVGGDAVKTSKTSNIVEVHNCYYMVSPRGRRLLSTFTFTPTMLLEGKEEDFVVGDMRAAFTAYVWKDVVLRQSSLRSLSALNKQLTKMSWTWLGRDNDVRSLQAYLMEQLQELGIPRAKAVDSIGRHSIEGDPRVFFACNSHTLASDGSIWTGAEQNPLLYVPTGREAPELALCPAELPTGEEYDTLVELLPRLNRAECIWPLIGWFSAAPLKTAIEALGYRFPILNITGTRGSGKTTLVVHIFQRLLGYEDPKSYNSSTTHFVTMSLLGSTNAIPIAFSEFRAAMSTDFLRYILLAYDTGRDARGRADQTTKEYPLIAPFTLDGEDRVDDPAAMERVIAVTLSPQTIKEGSPCYQAYQLLAQVRLEKFAYPYLAYTLTADVPALLDQAIDQIHEAFPMVLPDRIRRNVTVAWCGILAFNDFLAQHNRGVWPLEQAHVMTHALQNVYSPNLGRAPTAADSFVEFIVNVAAQKLTYFPWELEGTVLWFQLTPAFEYFCRQRAFQHRATLSRDAVRIQLGELEVDFTLPPAVRDIKGRRALAYGIDLAKAHKAGLDVPSSFDLKTIIVEFD